MGKYCEFIICVDIDSHFQALESEINDKQDYGEAAEAKDTIDSESNTKWNTYYYKVFLIQIIMRKQVDISKYKFSFKL